MQYIKKYVLMYMLASNPFISKKIIMSQFENLLEIKIAKKDLQLKAVYILNCNSSWEWMYYIYYYDAIQHAFYINDLDYPESEHRASAINCIENIMNKAFKQEMNSFVDILKKIQITKVPKVFCLYRQKATNFIVIDKVSLKTRRSKYGEILSFQKLQCNNGSKKINDLILK